MSRARILVVEDDPDIRELLSYTLGKEGYEVIAAASGEEGLRAAAAGRVDLAILDVMLPGMDGLQLLRKLKSGESTRGFPVLMASARGEDADVVAGLELGAEDYVTKPFSPRVLVARVRTALRRPEARNGERADGGVLERGGIRLDPGRHEVMADGARVELSATEFEVLAVLMAQPGRVYGRAAIIDRAKGGDYPVGDRSVDVQIVSLRRKLGPLGELIETVRGVGYRFRDG